MWRDPDFWRWIGDNVNAFLITLCALVGGASKFAKGEEKFSFGLYFFEFASSMSAGFIVCLFLKATSTPIELIGAISGLSAYFGTKILTILYQVLIVRIKKAAGVQDDEQFSKKDKEGKDE